MEAVVFLFPLLNLPSNDELYSVLKLMDVIDLIAFSLISKATKSLAVPFNLKCGSSGIRLSESLNIHFSVARYRVSFGLTREAKQTEHNAQLTVADTIKVTKIKNRVETNYEWIKPGFGIEEWIKHLEDLINTFNKSIEFCPGSERYNIGSVAKTLKGLGVYQVSVATNCSNLYSQLIQKTILTPRVRLVRNFYSTKESLQKILMSNYDSIDFRFMKTFSLEELLATNGKCLSLGILGRLTMDNLNKFIKMWKKGSNQNLRHMCIQRDIYDYRNPFVILKGIDHTVIDRAVERRFTRPLGDGEYVEMKSGGNDIHGVNGMKATLFTDSRWRIELFISN